MDEIKTNSVIDSIEELLKHNHNYELSDGEFDKIVNIDPLPYWLHRLIGDYHYKKKNYNQSATSYHKYIDGTKKRKVDFNLLGNKFFIKGEFQNADSFYIGAIRDSKADHREISKSFLCAIFENRSPSFIYKREIDNKMNLTEEALSLLKEFKYSKLFEYLLLLEKERELNPWEVLLRNYAGFLIGPRKVSAFIEINKNNKYRSVKNEALFLFSYIIYIRAHHSIGLKLMLSSLDRIEINVIQNVFNLCGDNWYKKLNKFVVNERIVKNKGIVGDKLIDSDDSKIKDIIADAIKRGLNDLKKPRHKELSGEENTKNVKEKNYGVPGNSKGLHNMVNQFLKGKKFWTVRFNGKDIEPLRDLKGMKYIHSLLSRKYDPLTYGELYNAIKGTQEISSIDMGNYAPASDTRTGRITSMLGKSIESGDERTKNDIIKRNNKLRSKLKDLYSKKDSLSNDSIIDEKAIEKIENEIEEDENEIEKLEKISKDYFLGKTMDKNDKKLRNAVRSAIDDSIKEISLSSQELAQHLTRYIKHPKGYITYHPPKEIEWITDK